MVARIEDRPARLTTAYVKGQTKPGRYSDGQGAFGLSLLVRLTARGNLSKTFAQRIRVGGTYTNIGIGAWPIVTLDEAREIALDNLRAIRKGGDPLADRRRESRTPTFRQVAEQVISLNAEGWRNPKTAQLWSTRLTEYAFPVIGNRRVDQIATADVLDVLMPIWSSKHSTAKATAQYIGRVFAFSIANGHRADNPADAKVLAAALPRTGSKIEHHKALPYRDLADALTKVDATDAYPTHKLALRFLALTAARSGEARGARWSEIDLSLSQPAWRIPAERMKQNREHVVPLTSEMLDVLAQAKQYQDGDDSLIFPAQRGGVLTDNMLSRRLRENEIPSTVHGLRSCFRDWAAESGVDRTVAEQCLAHAVGSAAELAYRRSTLLEQRREVMAAWSQVISTTEPF